MGEDRKSSSPKNNGGRCSGVGSGGSGLISRRGSRRGRLPRCSRALWPHPPDDPRRSQGCRSCSVCRRSKVGRAQHGGGGSCCIKSGESAARRQPNRRKLPRPIRRCHHPRAERGRHHSTHDLPAWRNLGHLTAGRIENLGHLTAGRIKGVQFSGGEEDLRLDDVDAAHPRQTRRHPVLVLSRAATARRRPRLFGSQLAIYPGIHPRNG